MEKIRYLDFSKLTLRDALDLAVLVEEEAKERYEEFASQMEIHHNEEAAAFFRFMWKVEKAHEDKLAKERRELFGDAPRVVRREMIFDVEAPEYDEVRAGMTVKDALYACLRAETKAFAFFEGALSKVTDDGVRKLFTELRDEEREHEGLVRKQLAKLPEDTPVNADDFSDEPVPQ